MSNIKEIIENSACWDHWSEGIQMFVVLTSWVRRQFNQWKTEETLALLLQVLHNWLCKPQNTLATVSLILLFFLWNRIKHQPHGPIGVYIYATQTLLCQKKIAGCIQQQAVPTCGQRWTKSITAMGLRMHHQYDTQALLCKYIMVLDAIQQCLKWICFYL